VPVTKLLFQRAKSACLRSRLRKAFRAVTVRVGTVISWQALSTEFALELCGFSNLSASDGNAVSASPPRADMGEELAQPNHCPALEFGMEANVPHRQG
jgi:hypothetical protein